MDYGVILAGGYGKRFWPLSRKHHPKQLLVVNSKPFIEETVERILPIFTEDNIYITCNKQIASPLKKRLKDVHFLVEPVARNTAAAIGLAATFLHEHDKKATLFIETADHYYEDVDTYLQFVNQGLEHAKRGFIVLIGIQPTSPHTGYGYIKSDKKVLKGDQPAYAIAAFKEKPDMLTAKKYIQDPRYLWNSGMFFVQAELLLQEIKQHMPALHDALTTIKKDGFSQHSIKEAFEKLASVPIDVGIIEKTMKTVVMKGNFPWLDIGDFASYEQLKDKDENGNVVDVHQATMKGNPKNCIILSRSKRSLELYDVEDLIIAETADCLLVAHKDVAQTVGQVVDILENEKGFEKYTSKVVDKQRAHYINIESMDCNIKTDGITVTVGVRGILIDRNKDRVVIQQKELE